MKLLNRIKPFIRGPKGNPDKPEQEDAGPKLRVSDLTEAEIRNLFRFASDVQIHAYDRANEPSDRNPLLVYCDGLIDGKQLNELVLLGGNDWLDVREDADGSPLPSLQSLRGQDDVQEFVRRVFEGCLLFFFPQSRKARFLPIAGAPKRDPSESNTEISVKGPRDGFTEDLTTNVALIRKRIRTPNLAIETFVVGKRTRTRAALLFMTDIAGEELVKEGRKRLNEVDMDGVLSSQQLEEGLAKQSLSLFPLVDYAGRPDYVAKSLLEGRIAIVIDGSPMALMAPSTVISLLESPEDLHQPYYFVIFERVLRIAGLVLSVLLPGFWVAVSAFNLEQIPFPLLATIVVSRLGLPLPGPLDLFLMLAMFELFREAGLRLPKAVGQTVAVVGGLIVGDAAINAGLTGPTSLVVSAVTAVANFTLVNQTLSGSVTLARFFILIMSCLLGMFGFFTGLFLLLLYLARLHSFGIPFLSVLTAPNGGRESRKGRGKR